MLAPLAEVAPDLELPDSGETAAAAWARIRSTAGPWLRPWPDRSSTPRDEGMVTRRNGVLPWRYIVVEGVIGVGKTSLVKLLATRTGARTNLEVVEENPFLGRFYQNRAAYAFQTQIFFLLSRFRQQQQLLPSPSCSRISWSATTCSPRTASSPT